MATEVILPKVDMDMATGTISKWLVADGDTVKKGQVIFEIETDKSAMEIDAPADGVIKLGDAKAGSVLPIGAVVAMIFAAGEKVTAIASASAVLAPVVQTTSNVQIESLGRRVDPADGGFSGGIRATPLARRLARQNGVDLVGVKGSGPYGRIVAEDVPPRVMPVVAPVVSGGTLKPLDGMRRIIAQRLTQSKQTVPHFYLSATCTIDHLIEIRARLNAKGTKLSINDFVIKAMALALQKVPDANVNYTEQGIVQFSQSDVGVAVSVEGGLFTPVIRNAEAKSLGQISTEMKDLAARARARKLQPEEYQGGSAAISNLGMFGVEQFTAIINPPQATILAVGTAVERFVPVNKQPVLATQMSVTLSCDHRAVDGAVGAQLLAAFKSLIEDPVMMLA
jgi:pyruvate dehydrogenase E2 component (dihydrolipoamide acetyltransferase)